MPKSFWIFPVLFLLIGSAPASAVDGAIEINQARALAGSVTPSDTAGFPVTLDLAGSYVLTSNLVVPDANTHGIEVLSDGVTIDFSGFAMFGPASCSGTTGSISCSNSGSGVGVMAESVGLPFPNQADGTVVKNGTISGMGSSGVELRERAHVDDMLIEHCASSAVRVEDDSLVTDSRIVLNGGLGIFAVSGIVNVRGNRIARVGGATHNATEIGGNTCDDVRCSAVPKRRYYLTTATATGDAVLTKCDEGYHTATFQEIADPSALLYDWVRGDTNGDTDFAPPSTRAGWIRNGAVGATAGAFANCDDWDSADSMHFGTTVSFFDPWSDPAVTTSPWSASTTNCSFGLGVWCVQD